VGEAAGAGAAPTARGEPLSAVRRDHLRDDLRAFDELARLYGVQRSFTGTDGHRHRPPRAAVLGALRALGAPIERITDAPDALRERRAALSARIIEPVVVAWDGAMPEVAVRAGPGSARRVRARLELEDGTDRPLAADPGGLRGTRVPLGAHRLEVSTGSAPAAAVVLAAPSRAPGDPAERSWGVFLPLYALRSREDGGVGDLAGLRSLLGWTAGLGGGTVGVLPIGAQFLGGPIHEPSPYSPASRLFWNELHIDLAGLPEASSPAVRTVLEGSELRREREDLRRGSLVDYDRAYATVRLVLEAAAGALFEGGGRRREALAAFERTHPLAREYARFRAVCERRGAWWGAWPARLREGTLHPSDGDRGVERQHRYAQFAASEQLAAVADDAARAGAGLQLDLPLAVNPAGFDVWRFGGLFALGTRGGAPPDLFQPKGQDWGFPPLHPEATRADGHAYLRAVVAGMARHASALRIDHVMGLHRLYWIPPGLDSTHGVYVRYPAEELYAAILLEAHRHGTRVVGEDLGTVPAEVRRSMRRHGVLRSYVAEFAFRPRRPSRPIRPPAAGQVASLETHDLPPFAAYWEALDVEDRMALGLIQPSRARRIQDQRARLRERLLAHLVREGWVDMPGAGVDTDGAAAGRLALRGCLRLLAASEAAVVVVNLEDLWWERRPQNVPGTGPERPNWRRRARHPLEAFPRLPGVEEVLTEVNRLRREAAALAARREGSMRARAGAGRKGSR
jgi:4-alpha-glucanotransferase